MTRPDSLHDTFGSSPNGRSRLAHGSMAPDADRRLRQVVDDEPETGHLPGHDQRRRQLARADEEVVGQAGRLDRGQPAPHVRAEEPVRVGLVVDLVADPDEPLPARPAAQRVERSADAPIGQVDPSDHAADERDGRCGREELAGLFQAADRLDEDRPIDAGRGELRREVLGAETPIDRRELGVSHG